MRHIHQLAIFMAVNTLLVACSSPPAATRSNPALLEARQAVSLLGEALRNDTTLSVQQRDVMNVHFLKLAETLIYAEQAHSIVFRTTTNPKIRWRPEDIDRAFALMLDGLRDAAQTGQQVAPTMSKEFSPHGGS